MNATIVVGLLSLPSVITKKRNKMSVITNRNANVTWAVLEKRLPQNW